MKHTITITHPRFWFLPWPLRTETYSKETSCGDAERIASQLRYMGAKQVVVSHEHNEGDR